ncbi:MAG: hypothetical protein AB1791_22490 [Chloroflexota bacterium]
MLKNRAFWLLLVLVLIATFAATRPATAGPDTMTPRRVAIRDASFAPQLRYAIFPGDTIVWKNTSQLEHTVTSEAGLFDSGILYVGDTFTWRPWDVGTYFYRCVIHDGMRGAIYVQIGQ